MSNDVNENEQVTPQPASENAEQTPASAEQVTVEQKNDEKAPVPYDRFKSVNDRLTAAEALNQKHVKEVKKTEEANLAATEIVKIRDQEIVDLKAGIEKDKLEVQYVDAVKDKGFSEKVAKLGIPKDLSADNLLDSVKQFTKEYKEFKIVEGTKETPNEAVSSVAQPGAPTPPPDNRTPETKMGDFAKQQILNGQKR